MKTFLCQDWDFSLMLDEPSPEKFNPLRQSHKHDELSQTLLSRLQQPQDLQPAGPDEAADWFISDVLLTLPHLTHINRKCFILLSWSMDPESWLNSFFSVLQRHHKPWILCFCVSVTVTSSTLFNMQCLREGRGSTMTQQVSHSDSAVLGGVTWGAAMRPQSDDAAEIKTSWARFCSVSDSDILTQTQRSLP